MVKVFMINPVHFRHRQRLLAMAAAEVLALAIAIAQRKEDEDRVSPPTTPTLNPPQVNDER